MDEIYNKVKIKGIVMQVLFSQEKRMEICKEVLSLQKTNSGKVCNIVKEIAEKYNVKPNRIYTWNKGFNYIFQNDLFSDDEKKQILEEVKNLAVEKKISFKKAITEITAKYNISTKVVFEWNRYLKVFVTKQKFANIDIIYILTLINTKADKDNLGSLVLFFANKFSVAPATVYAWNCRFSFLDVRVYKNRQTGKYSYEFKREVLEEFKYIGFTYENIKEIAKKYSIQERNIYEWNRFFKLYDTKIYKKNENEQFQNEIIKKLETDNDFKKELEKQVDEILEKVKEQKKLTKIKEKSKE